jgi:hypothetical protein
MTDPAVAFLREHNVEVGHSGRTLLDHLLGTRALLEAWGQREALCLAGLFHSVYGTESFRKTTIPTDLRPRVQALIGDEAEALAWLFGVLENRAFLSDLHPEVPRVRHRQTGEAIPLTHQQHSDLCQMVAANALEQLDQIPPERLRRALAWMEPLRDKIGGPGAAALQDAIVRIDAMEGPRGRLL